MDYLNPTFVEENLIPFSREEVGSVELIQYRKVEKGHVLKKSTKLIHCLKMRV